MRFAVHPLFLLFGVWYAFSGRLFLFLVSTLVALMHECGHAFAAARVGYRLDKIVLMPYGALISGDIEGIGLKDEIKVTLAGPLVNAATAVLFVALWWFFPETYAYTDVAAYASAAIALVNLIPAYPLDGGRILYCAAAAKKGEKFARRLARGAGLVFAAAMLALFVYGCICAAVNLTVLFFAAFLFAGAREGMRIPSYPRRLRAGDEKGDGSEAHRRQGGLHVQKTVFPARTGKIRRIYRVRCGGGIFGRTFRGRVLRPRRKCGHL